MVKQGTASLLPQTAKYGVTYLRAEYTAKPNPFGSFPIFSWGSINEKIVQDMVSKKPNSFIMTLLLLGNLPKKDGRME